MKTKIMTLFTILISTLILTSCLGGSGKRTTASNLTAVADLCSEVEFTSADCSCTAYGTSASLSCGEDENACEMLESVPSGYICGDNVLSPSEDDDYTPGVGGEEPRGVAPPAFSPTASSHSAAISVTISSATPGASIRWRYDPSVPTCTSGYTSQPINISSGTKTINAIACKTGMTASETQKEYTILAGANTVAQPAFSHQTGSYSSAQNIIITCATSGATIRYALNGATPNCTTSTAYSTPVQVSSTNTLKAIACKSGMIDSAITTATYTINLNKVGAPQFNPLPGTYQSNDNLYVQITSPTTGAGIRYTNNGIPPTSCSDPNSVSMASGSSLIVAVNQTMTFGAIACKYPMTDSDVVTGTFEVVPVGAPVPTMQTASGTYDVPLYITENQPILKVYMQIPDFNAYYSNADIDIYYTTDGSIPGCAETGTTEKLTSTYISLSPSNTPIVVKAKTCRRYSGGAIDISEVAQRTYTVRHKCPRAFNNECNIAGTEVAPSSCPTNQVCRCFQENFYTKEWKCMLP